MFLRTEHCLSKLTSNKLCIYSPGWATHTTLMNCLLQNYFPKQKLQYCCHQPYSGQQELISSLWHREYKFYLVLVPFLVGRQKGCKNPHDSSSRVMCVYMCKCIPMVVRGMWAGMHVYVKSQPEHQSLGTIYFSLETKSFTEPKTTG